MQAIADFFFVFLYLSKFIDKICGEKNANP